MIEESKLRQLKSSLEDKLIAKENFVKSIQKKTQELKFQKQSKEFAQLQNEFASEEKLSCALKKTEKHIERLQLVRELKEQVANKELQREAERAECLIESLTLRTQDEESIKECQKNKEEKEAQKHESRKLLETQHHYKELARKQLQEKDAVFEDSSQQYNVLDSLRQEYERQKRERLRLEKCSTQIGLRSSLENKMLFDEELRQLREEESCLKKAQEEDERSERRREVEIRKTQKLLEERQLQERAKEDMKLYEKRREEEYVRLLSELLDEEERLEQMRVEVRRRKQLEHRLAAQRVLEERRRRRKALVARENAMLQEERDFEALRNAVMEEEEKKLLLQYLPHLSPLLSSKVIQRLSAI